MMKRKFVSKLSQVPQIVDLPAHERVRLEQVEERYHFLSNEYYLSLIDWEDEDDPIRRIAIPDELELRPWGKLDASNEHKYVAAPGCEHKYDDTALLLANNVCGTFCRFCFRKRLFIKGNQEVNRDVGAGIEYIRQHSEINNVLITGGDPILLTTKRLEKIIAAVDEIDHVGVIRIGTKMIAFNPYRFLDDPELIEMLGRYSRPDRRLYLMGHFNHPRELTEPAREVVEKLLEAGVVVMNQTPMIRGVNDDPEVLGELFDTLSYMGVAPYYVFQCRPTEGNFDYTVPVEEGYAIFREAQRTSSGLARRARFAMSHATGKIEVVGMSDDYIFFRYQRAADEENEGRLLMAERNENGYWFDDYSARDPEDLLDGDSCLCVVS